MRLPVIQGVIRRRILANFRVDAQAMQREIPARFRPKLHNGLAIAGICLIRLEHIRPRAMPEIIWSKDEARFPKSTIEFDHALIMRNVQHEWHSADDLYL